MLNWKPMNAEQLQDIEFWGDWMRTVRESTGFLKSTPKPIDINALPPEVRKFIDEQIPYYDKMKAMKLIPEKALQM